MRLARAGILGAHQHRSVEQRAHLRERVGEFGGKSLEVVASACGAGVSQILDRSGPLTHCRVGLGDGSAGHGDRELLARLGAAQNGRDAVAQFLLRDHGARQRRWPNCYLR